MHEKVSNTSVFYSFLGGIGAILIFLLILMVAYLPNRPEPVDQSVEEDRQLKADEARAAGIKKISEFAVVNADQGVFQIPVEDAIELTLREYREGKPAVEEAVEPAGESSDGG